jgi:hypothetical protein
MFRTITCQGQGVTGAERQQQPPVSFQKQTMTGGGGQIPIQIRKTRAPHSRRTRDFMKSEERLWMTSSEAVLTTTPSTAEQHASVTTQPLSYACTGAPAAARARAPSPWSPPPPSMVGTSTTHAYAIWKPRHAGER